MRRNPPPVVVYDDNDNELELPTTWEVCPRCNGTGVHDAWEGGLTSSEMHELDDDFFEDYAAGRYDVPCSECNGERLVAIVDEDALTPEQARAWLADCEWRADAAAERAMEARWCA